MAAPSIFGEGESLDAAEARSGQTETSSPAASSAFASTSSLYRKYRPQTFDSGELVGQEHVTRTLRNAIALDRVAHAYLFCGPRGTGKTTTARLLAKAVNCLAADPGERPCSRCASCLAINNGTAPDIIEIDAASNRGIDDIRDLRERVRYAPAQLRSKVYIIDEAHQITGAAANAFLKTLEEPPAHTRFILATTDPEELLPTIVSRCQRFDFRRVSADNMVRRLRTVATHEQIAIEDEALLLVARHATGSLRDALGLLEQLALGADTANEVSDSTPIASEDVRAALGLSRNDRVETLVEALGDRDAALALRTVQEAVDDGEDPRQLNRQLLLFLRQLLAIRSGATADGEIRARDLASRFTIEQLVALARRFGEIDFTIKHAPYPQLPLEIALVEATTAPSPEQTRDSGPAPTTAERPEATNPARPTALRDRVRAPAAIRELPGASPARTARADPAPITPLRTAPADTPAMVPAAAAGDFDVEQIAALWPNVRADVKALNRRIEALLSEVDPVAISGNQITLAVPYPFHRDKLNTDDVRETVAGVLSRLLDREVSLTCVLRGELTTPEPVPVDLSTRAAISSSWESSTDEDAEERDRLRLRAAMNIFDAEEIEPLDTAASPAPADA